MFYIYTMKYYTTYLQKKYGIPPFAATWMDLKGIKWNKSA